MTETELSINDRVRIAVRRYEKIHGIVSVEERRRVRATARAAFSKPDAHSAKAALQATLFGFESSGRSILFQKEALAQHKLRAPQEEY